MGDGGVGVSSEPKHQNRREELHVSSKSDTKNDSREKLLAPPTFLDDMLNVPMASIGFRGGPTASRTGLFRGYSPRAGDLLQEHARSFCPSHPCSPGRLDGTSVICRREQGWTFWKSFHERSIALSALFPPHSLLQQSFLNQLH